MLLAAKWGLAAGPMPSLAADPVEVGGKLYTQDSDNRIPLFYTQLHLQKKLGVFSNKEALLLENRKPQAGRQTESPQKERERLLGSLAVEGEGQAFYLGHRYLPGPRTSYLLDPDALSSLSNLPNGRKAGSLWWLLRLGNRLGDFQGGAFAIEGASGTGLTLGQQGLWQLRVHPAAKSGSLSVALGKAQEDSLYLDLLHEKATTEGYGRLYLKNKSGTSHFFLEGERRAYYDQIESRDIQKSQGSLSQESLSVPLTKIHSGKNGRLNLQSCLWDRLCLESAGEDRGLRAARFAGSILLWPVFSLKDSRLFLQAGIYGMALRRYPWPGAAHVREPHSKPLADWPDLGQITGAPRQQENCPMPAFRDALLEGRGKKEGSNSLPPLALAWEKNQTAATETKTENRSCLSGPGFVSTSPRAGRFYGDTAGMFGLVLKGNGLALSLYFLRGKRAAMRFAAELGLEGKSWKLNFGAIYLAPGNDFPSDFYWLRVPEDDRASLRFHYEGNAALRLRFLSRYLALSFSLAPYYGKTRLQSRMEWRLFF